MLLVCEFETGVQNKLTYLSGRVARSCSQATS